MSKQVFIIEDHEDLAMALRLVFDGDPGFHVCGVAHDIPEALEMMPDAGADLVTIDINLPCGSGLDHIGELLALNPSARFLTISQEDPAVFGPIARNAGASGYLRKGAAPKEIVEVASMVLDGEEYFPELPDRG